MSHFSTVKTRLRNLGTVKQALEELGYEVHTGNVHGFMGNQTHADLVLHTGNGYDIGFRMNGEEVEAVADFWGLHIDREAFFKQLTQRYAYITVMEQAQVHGWAMATEEVQQDGSIRLVMQRWG